MRKLLNSWLAELMTFLVRSIYRNSVSDITACAQISELEHNRHIKDV